MWNKAIHFGNVRNVALYINRGYWRHARYISSSATSTVTENKCANIPKPYESIPGLSKLPLIGPLHHFLPVIGKIGRPESFVNMLEVFHKEFGPIVKFDGLFGRANMVILFEPDHYDQVYRAEDVTPSRPGFDTFLYYKEVLRKDVYNGVFRLTSAQGPQWRDFRTKVNPAFLKPKIIKLYSSGLEEIAKEMVSRLVKLDSGYIENNFDFEMKKYSLESVSLVGLGARLGCLQDNLTDDHPARQLMKSGDIFDLALKMELNPIQLWRHFTTPGLKKIVDILDKQWQISKMYIQQARGRIKARGHDIPEEDKSIIEKLLAIDETVAIMMANEMLFAGIDTVAFSSTAILYHLASNPNVQDKLREEVRYGDSNRRYLKACLKESLRLNPVITSQLRRTTEEHVVGGYCIPIGVDVIAPVEYLSKTEKYYPRPKEYIPERWLADKSDPLYYGNAHPMVYLPFGFGVRSCIGRRIAELEIETLVHSLVKDYIVKWEGPPLKVVTSVMTKIKKPFPFKFQPIK